MLITGAREGDVAEIGVRPERGFHGNCGECPAVIITQAELHRLQPPNLPAARHGKRVRAVVSRQEEKRK